MAYVYSSFQVLISNEIRGTDTQEYKDRKQPNSFSCSVQASRHQSSIEVV